MLKPENFKKAHVSIRNLPYQMFTEHSEGGVLGRGRVIWTRDQFGAKRPHSAMAYVEEIGTILVDPRWLKMADAPGL
jgi:hypothetical protein